MAIEARRRDGATGVGAPALGEAVDRIASLPGLLEAVGNRDRGLLAPVHGERYRALLQALGVAVYTTDADGRIDFYNDAAAAFWGRRPEMGEMWCGSWRLYRPDGTPLPHDECPMAMALRDERPIRDHEAVAERPDGSRIAFVPYPTPLHDEDGRLVGAVNVLVDVTERKRAEDAVLAAAEALRASNAVKDEFLGLVSHELRTPVTTIFGNARLLRDRRDRLSDENQRSMVADIADDSERLLGVIENLLLLTRIDSGSEFELEPLVFSHVIHQSVDSFRRRHASRPVSIDSGQRHIIVEADRTYLELLMENLLSNAHKYSPPGKEVSVTVRLADGEAQVAVLDRGIGIEGSDPERLFTPFYRTDAAKRLTGGIGIGLAVCRRVLETQGGRIWARARAGGGSEFGFALPLTPDAREPAES